jgi:hypothetical protein
LGRLPTTARFFSPHDISTCAAATATGIELQKGMNINEQITRQGVMSQGPSPSDIVVPMSLMLIDGAAGGGWRWHCVGA